MTTTINYFVMVAKNIYAKKRLYKVTKAMIYAYFGIEYRASDGKIKAPGFGWIKPLMKNGNSKIGKGAFHFSTLPTTKAFTFIVNGIEYHAKGTCKCTCDDCYACTGHYVQNNVKASLGINTILCACHLDFVKRAIVAQIIADNVKIVRVHVAGDFNTFNYIDMWRDIAKTFSGIVVFWTYTKNEKAEHAFDDIINFNVVHSLIDYNGKKVFNFGTCSEILALYDYLKSQGKTVYICKCGFDDTQHCIDCGACRNCEHVLFVKHSTSDYDAKVDPLYNYTKEIVMSQDSTLAKVA